MNWNPRWDLGSIPEEEFLSELGRRNAAKREYPPSCGHTKPQPKSCPSCKKRVYRRKRRAEGKDR